MASGIKEEIFTWEIVCQDNRKPSVVYLCCDGRNVSNRSEPSRKIGPSSMKRRPLKTAAVTITGLKEDCSYATAIKKAKQSISLDKLNIEGSKFRRIINGRRIIEIPGEGAAEKADSLAHHLRSVLGNDFAINRPVIRGELRILDLDDATTPEDVAAVIAGSGGCSLFDIKVGAIRTLNNDIGSIWAQYPLAAAIKVANNCKIMIGWSNAQVILLEKRPLQCFKCWQFGHVKYNCLSEINLTGLCFRCGEKGHNARNCFANPRCLVCEKNGHVNDHRYSSVNCRYKPMKNDLNIIQVPADRRVPADSNRNAT